MILAGNLATPVDVERFRREAGAAARLDHPHIVPISEVGEHEGQHYFSMKFIEGGNLGRDLPHFTANHRAAAHLLAKASRAVQHAHERGILHRDLKPGNILLDAAKQPHVTDFGLTRRLDESSSLSASGAVIGTASYMAPEQAAAQSRRLTAAADIYALGAILYEMLTGRPPFRNASMVQTLRDVVEREPERPRKLNPRIPVDLETIGLRCLDKRPGRRLASAAALADDLENWVARRPIQTRSVGLAERAWLGCRRQPVVVGVTVAAVLALLVGSGLATVSYLKGQRHQVAAEKSVAVANQLGVETEGIANAAREREDTARYETDMRQAGAYAEGQDYPALRQLLEKWRPVPGGPDYRHWEWYYLRAVAARDSLLAPEKADPHSPEEWYVNLPGSANNQPIVRLRQTRVIWWCGVSLLAGPFYRGSVAQGGPANFTRLPKLESGQSAVGGLRRLGLAARAGMPCRQAVIRAPVRPPAGPRPPSPGRPSRPAVAPGAWRPAASTRTPGTNTTDRAGPVALAEGRPAARTAIHPPAGRGQTSPTRAAGGAARAGRADPAGAGPAGRRSRSLDLAGRIADASGCWWMS